MSSDMSTSSRSTSCEFHASIHCRANSRIHSIDGVASFFVSAAVLAPSAAFAESISNVRSPPVAGHVEPNAVAATKLANVAVSKESAFRRRLRPRIGRS